MMVEFDAYNEKCSVYRVQDDDDDAMYYVCFVYTSLTWLN